MSKDTLEKNEMHEEVEQAPNMGSIFANPASGEEVVITGMAGRFPDSDDIYQYRDNILNKTDMVSDDDRRWEANHPEIPHRTGKINFIEKFDAGAFGVHHRQAHAMDPACRQVLERAYEAILDAGYHPEELRGTNTGVFIGTCFSETERTWLYDNLNSPTFGFTGCTRSMQAQRISYFLGLEGPSYIMDTACSSSLYALEHAYRAIKSGRCDSALVGGANLCLHPIVSLQFARLGVLSLDGSCKSFDADANGYARSETITVIYLQKQKDAKRIYAQIVHAKTNSDGYKEQGITFPSGADQKQLLNEMYQECNVDPGIVDFLEAHATGTRVGDPEELMAMSEVFCSNRKTPLYIGSIKSNLGHTEPSSGLCSVVKVVLGMEMNGFLPNINYSRPREGSEGLEKGKMIVVTENTSWPENGSGLAAVNCFGFGGSNGHVLLKRFKKPKDNNGQPKDDLPRLMCVSSRTESGIKHILDDITQRALDVEFIRILHEIFRFDLTTNAYRGVALMSKSGMLSRSYQWFDGVRQPLCMVLGRSSKRWLKNSKQLFAFPVFATAIKRINLLWRSVAEKENPNNIENVNVEAFAVQIALVDVLKIVGLCPDHIISYSSGELIAAYVDGALTLKQTLSAFYQIEQFLCKIGKVSAKKYNPELDLQLIKHLKEIIPEPKQRTANWISTFTNASNLPNEGLKYASAEYFAESVSNSLGFTEIKHKIPSKSVLLVVGSDYNRLQHHHMINMFVDEGDQENSINVFLNGLGRLFKLGYNLNLDKLYPTVQWPVSVGTPMVSPLIKWNHSDDWFVVLYKSQKTIQTVERVISFTVKEPDWSFMEGHVIDGRNLIPATCYLVMVWETLAMIKGLLLSDMQIVFENVKFHRATNISRNEGIELIISLQKGTCQFEVGELGQTVVTGKVFIPEDFTNEIVNLPQLTDENNVFRCTTEDIYTEFKLRGYNYRGLFRGLKGCNTDASKGSIEWTGNWISFMDNMLQLKLLKGDTRNVYVPTSIERLVIDAKAHIRYANKFKQSSSLPVYVHQESEIIRSGYIEIRGVNASSILRRKQLGNLVLEVQKFVPFETELSLEQSIRVVTQIVLENNYSIGVRVVELVDESTKKEATVLSPIMYQALNDQPMIKADIVVMSKEPLELENITVENKALLTETDTCSIVMVSNISARPQIQKQAITVLKENGFILSREEKNFVPDNNFFELTVIAVYQTEEETLVLLRKPVKNTYSITIDISKHLTYDWLPMLQAAVKTDKKVTVVAENAPISGILGFVKCLSREIRDPNLKCVFIMDNAAPKFDINFDFYSKQLEKGLMINVFRDGKWGTYRHLLLEKETVVQREHVFCNVTTAGDLSSLKWIEGPLTGTTCLPPEKLLVNVYCASLNFRDIMTASGRISNDVITKDRIEQYNVQGIEFSGRNLSGKRVMGMINSGALASMVTADSYLLWEIPDNLSMKDAATLPITYGTVIYGVVVIAQIKRGQSILIHAGSGGVGQAAINVALYYKCNIFTTVGTKEKRDFIRKTFPQIAESHIGNSRDTSFEQMVLRETNGEGVDIVLNSLSEEKLQASVRCLAPGGKFLEIGKFDLAKNNPLRCEMFTQNRSIYGIMLDGLFVGPPSLKRLINHLMVKGLATGMVKPLTRTIFKKEEVEQAYRHMAAGKHIGKVIIQLREEEQNLKVISRATLFDGIPRFYSHSDKSYVIVGGLGGFGLELADWLVLRGAKNLLLVSRSGIRNGYQDSRLRIWKSYGVTTKISTADATTKQGCIDVIKEANRMAPVEGIFNLAVVLKDSLLENQNEDSFKATLAPKAIATRQLDEVSRELCPDLLYFVVFSSVVAGRGNAGQTNYGMANSIMERICEERKKDGYPALAVQWGAVGEVGLVAKMQESETEIEIGGTLQQRITSCLEVMDVFLRQNEAVVSSIVVAQKKGGSAESNNLVESVKDIMGIRDLKTVSLHATLSELGMDSMTAVEIKQTLERKSDIFLTAKDIRNLTFARLQEMANENELSNEKNRAIEEKNVLEGVELLLRFTITEKDSVIPMLRLPSLVKEKSVAPKVFLLPGIDGMSYPLETLASNLAFHTFCLQLTYSNEPKHTIEDMAKSLLPLVQENLPGTTPFTLVAYSYSCTVAIELAAILEDEGRAGKVILIDGAPALLKELIKQQLPEADSEDRLQTRILCSILQLYCPLETVLKNMANIFNCKTLEERINTVLSLTPENAVHSKRFQRQVCLAAYFRFKSVLLYQPMFRKLKSVVKLFKPTQPLLPDFAEDYKLQELCENQVEICTFSGDHVAILKNPEVAYTVNKIIGISTDYPKELIMKELSNMEHSRKAETKQI